MAQHRPRNDGKALLAENLSIVRDDGQRQPFRLHDLSLRLQSGSLMVLRGASGCGKSTLLMALARLIPMDLGALSLDGVSARNCPSPTWRSRVSLATAEPALVDGSIAENLLLPWNFRAYRGATPPDVTQMEKGLAGLGIDAVDIDADVRSLSTGQAARVALLRHLLVRPDYLLLDEPTPIWTLRPPGWCGGRWSNSVRTPAGVCSRPLTTGDAANRIN